MKNLRNFAILDFLKEKKYCSYPELMEHFQVSPATIHRDISSLADKGLLRKVHGGAAYPEEEGINGKMTILSPSFQERINWNRTKKRAIAERAYQTVSDGDILFLDSSTTVFFLAERLLDSSFPSLTILTNSAMIIQNFHKFPKHYVLIGIGGSFDHQLNAFLGQSAVRQLDAVTITKAYVSAFGFGPGSVTTNHENHAEFLAGVLARSRKNYLLVDNTKRDRAGLFRIGLPEQFARIITD